MVKWKRPIQTSCRRILARLQVSRKLGISATVRFFKLDQPFIDQLKNSININDGGGVTFECDAGCAKTNVSLGPAMKLGQEPAWWNAPNNLIAETQVKLDRQLVMLWAI